MTSAINTFECEVCGEVAPDSEGRNVMHDDSGMTVCAPCYDTDTMDDIES